MASQPIEPLRIQKSTPAKSPNKFNAASNRPLSELSPMALRRNSPSFPGNKTSNLFKTESSPFGSSPLNVTTKASPLLFWQGRDPSLAARENQSPYEGQSPSPAKRSSLENLKKASRVKNSNMFAKEQRNFYDPASPSILDRPLANRRPLSMQLQGNAFGGQGMQGLRKDIESPSAVKHVSEIYALEDANTCSVVVAPLSPSKSSTSPTKSSLSKRTGANAKYGFDPETGIWADDDPSEKHLPEGKGLHRHAKSVTFDQAPPQINEYEMTTPDPSSVASGSREGSYDSVDDDEDMSFERGSSLDRDDSFDASLEDTDKTPVVLPEDWRFMSPDIANTDLAQHEEDVFDDGEYGSPAPSAQPGALEYRPHQTSINSVDSNGQPRPLPPLPSLNASTPDRRDGLSSTIERMSNAQRSLPSPPQATSISKSDIRRMSGGSLSLEDRLRLMMLQEQEQEKSEAERQRERRMRRAGSKDPSPTREALRDSKSADDDDEGSPGPSLVDEPVENSNEPTRISRESILRRLRSQQSLRDLDEHGSRRPHYDPDVPIPSLEDPTQVTVRDAAEEEIVIKEEESDDNDLYSIPDLYSQSVSGESESEETASQYSQTSIYPPLAAPMEDGQETPRAQSPIREPQKKSLPVERVSLPEFTEFGDESSFDLGLSSYMTPPTEQVNTDKPLPPDPAEAALPDLSELRASIQRPFTPDEQLQPPRFSPTRNSYISEPGTPDSVIRHPIAESPLPEIAEPEATIKAPGSRLKTRPSLTPVDVETMAATRRQVSAQLTVPTPDSDSPRPQPGACEETQFQEQPEVQDSAPEISEDPLQTRDAKKRVSSLVQLDIPRDQSDEGLGFGLEKEFDRVLESQKVAFERSLQRLYYPFNGRFPSSELPDPKDSKIKDPTQNVPTLPPPRGARALPGYLPAHSHICPVDGSVFANRLSYRQRGYLMRQNTKVVVASERISHDEPRPTTGSAVQADTTVPSDAPVNEVQVSPRKISQPTWTAEPWNGKSRRKSIRVGGEKSPTKRKPVEGPAPPLPGQASNVQEGLEALAEDELAEEEAEDHEDGTERGRLFVKVVGVKDLELPLPQHERTSFALTLDNGLHCVTTAWLDLARSAQIGQEFELVVLNDLEFQLTLQMKLEEPKPDRPQSPTKAPSSPKKQGAFGRLFGSPKKRKESELRAQQEMAKQRPVTPPSAYEMVQGLVAKDGSFARAYVALSEHEKQAYGRPYTVDIMCFNEWALEEVQVGSSRSKKSVTQLQRRPPYPIGKLELQLLYIPKPKGAKDEDMPKSMNSAVRELRDAETKMSQQMKEFEGHLSQQGGDCPYWRRRFFKLVGPKLTAYHEATLQPRATINLAKASKLIDDKSALTQKETSTKGGGRRKSAFAEEEEGYMFVEEGFRIRFANGEVIDFYADTAENKDEWMKVLSQVVGKGPSGPSASVKPWVETVLRREKSTVAKERKSKPAATKAHQELSRGETVVRNPHAARPLEHAINNPSMKASTIPSPTRPAPRPGHSRTGSHPPQSGSRSQANSPVKLRMSREERHKKTKSMIDMQFNFK